MGSNLTSKSLKLVDQSSRDLFPRTQKESIQKTSLFDLDILSRFGDIRNQNRTVQKIDRNFACFWPLIFFRGATLLSQIPIMWQSFAAIGRGTSEMWLPKKTSAVKQNPVRNYRSGRPNQIVKSSMLCSEPRTAQRMSYIASTVFGDSLERASVVVRLTADKSLQNSSWTELVEMQRMRLATSVNNGNSQPFSFHQQYQPMVPFVSYQKLGSSGRAGFNHDPRIIYEYCKQFGKKEWNTQFVNDAEFPKYKSDGYQEVLVVATNIYQCSSAMNHI